MQTPLQQMLIVAVVLLNGYCFGANCVERFVNYQTFSLIPADAFKAYHRSQQPLIQIFVVAPLAVGLVLQIWLALSPPVGLDSLVAWVDGRCLRSRGGLHRAAAVSDPCCL